MLKLVTKVTLLDPTARTMLITSATRFPSRMRDAEAGHQGYSSGPYCKNHVDHKCHKVPKQNERKVPRKECKTIVDTTYIEECEDIIHEKCHETHVQTHHSSKVVGHDSQVVDHHSHGYGYHKRSADAEPE